MAETEPQVDAPQDTEDAAPKAKKTTRKRPAKKRAAKKPAKKTVKKTRVTKKKDESDASKTATSKKQPAKKRPAKKSGSKAKDEGRTVISSPPSKRREAQKAAAEADQAVSEEKTQQGVQEAPENKQAEEATAMQWGRRSKRSGPIAWEDHASSGSSSAQPKRRPDSSAGEQPAEAESSVPAEEPKEAPAEAKAEAAPSGEPSASVEEPKEAPTESTRGGQNRSNTRKPSSRSDRGRSNRSRNEKSDQDNRRSSRNNTDRGRSNRSRNEKSDQDNRRSSQQSNNRNRGRQRDEKPDSSQPSRTLAEVLAQSWTEDKTRRFLSDGFLSSLSPELTHNGKSEPIPDAEALKEPLQMIRKVLADECMVADDVTDLMLLDVVMNALSDRIEVCRLQAESTSLEDMDVILDLRYKADKRLIEAVNALKNA